MNDSTGYALADFIMLERLIWILLLAVILGVNQSKTPMHEDLIKIESMVDNPDAESESENGYEVIEAPQPATFHIDGKITQTNPTVTGQPLVIELSADIFDTLIQYKQSGFTFKKGGE